MSSNLGDQDLVRQLTDQHPERILPAFGLHPWWSHHISFAETRPLKRKHYATVFPGCFEAESGDDEALLASFPEPTLFQDYVEDVLKPRLLQYPAAMLGEVGLDKVFRIPHPQTEVKTDRNEGKAAKRFTNLRTSTEHQLRLLREQLGIAFELDRNVSMHSVQAQGSMMELLAALPEQSKYWSRSRSKICMHSYGGSVDTIRRLHKLHPERIYFSFSTTINGRLDRLNMLIAAVPDDRLLIESDFNDIRKSELKMWEMLGRVCEAKNWSAEEAVQTLERNWGAFSASDVTANVPL